MVFHCRFCCFGCGGSHHGAGARCCGCLNCGVGQDEVVVRPGYTGTVPADAVHKRGCCGGPKYVQPTTTNTHVGHHGTTHVPHHGTTAYPAAPPASGVPVQKY